MSLIEATPKNNFTQLELIGANAIGLNHALANHVTILSAVTGTLRNSLSNNLSPSSYVESGCRSIEDVCSTITAMINVLNIIRMQILPDGDVFTFSEFKKILVQDLPHWGWVMESDCPENAKIRTNHHLLQSSIKELMAQTKTTGRLLIRKIQGKSEVAALGMPLHLGRNPYLHLTFVSDEQDNSNNTDLPLRRAQCNASSEVFRLIGCPNKGLLPESKEMTVLIPIESLE